MSAVPSVMLYSHNNGTNNEILRQKSLQLVVYYNHNAMEANQRTMKGHSTCWKRSTESVIADDKDTTTNPSVR